MTNLKINYDKFNDLKKKNFIKTFVIFLDQINNLLNKICMSQLFSL